MTAKLPPDWATSELYLSGPDVGTATKVDPSSPENGFIRGVVAAAQHVNFLFNAMVSASRRSITATAMAQRRLSREGETIDDTQDIIAAACKGEGFPVIAIKANTNGVLLVDDSDVFFLGDTLTSITAAYDAALDPNTGRIVVVGDGGVFNERTDNNGGTWTAGGTTTELRTSVVWDDTNGRFITMGQGDPTIYRSTNGVAWSSALASPGARRGIGVTDAGIAVVFENAGNPDVLTSSDGGATWTPHTPPFPGIANVTAVAGKGGSVVCAAYNTTALLTVATSIDGVTWTERMTAAPPAGVLWSLAAVQVLADSLHPEAFVVQVEADSGMSAFYLTLDAGGTWSDPIWLTDTPVYAAAFAGGKLITTQGEHVFTSDGIGFE